VPGVHTPDRSRPPSCTCRRATGPPPPPPGDDPRPAAMIGLGDRQRRELLLQQSRAARSCPRRRSCPRSAAQRPPAAFSTVHRMPGPLSQRSWGRGRRRG
jgi:hypothetical protein